MLCSAGRRPLLPSQDQPVYRQALPRKRRADGRVRDDGGPPQPPGRFLCRSDNSSSLAAGPPQRWAWAWGRPDNCRRRPVRGAGTCSSQKNRTRPRKGARALERPADNDRALRVLGPLGEGEVPEDLRGLRDAATVPTEDHPRQVERGVLLDPLGRLRSRGWLLGCHERSAGGGDPVLPRRLL
jgi:hypothetical protein